MDTPRPNSIERSKDGRLGQFGMTFRTEGSASVLK